MRHLTLSILVTLAVLLGSAGESFALSKCPGSPTDDRSVWGQWHNCEGIVSQSDGLTHEGEFRNGLPNGQGTLTFSAPHKSAGEKYVGEFKDGKPNGQGALTFADGRKYVGEYKDDKRNGQGTYTKPDGKVFEGIFENGKFKYAKKP